MSDSHPEPTIRHTRQATEYIYEPTRRSVHIQEGDWDRWIRTITRIPKQERSFRDWSFASFGISIPSFLSALAIGISNSGIPTWPLFVYLVGGVSFLVIGLVCRAFDKKMEEIATRSVQDILEDMNEVRERSAVSEEQVRAPQPPVAIG